MTCQVSSRSYASNMTNLMFRSCDLLRFASTVNKKKYLLFWSSLGIDGLLNRDHAGLTTWHVGFSLSSTHTVPYVPYWFNTSFCIISAKTWVQTESWINAIVSPSNCTRCHKSFGICPWQKHSIQEKMIWNDLKNSQYQFWTWLASSCFIGTMYNM